MDKPSEAVIAKIKADFPDRSVFLVEGEEDGGVAMQFIMTAPNRDEYKFYVGKMVSAEEKKDTTDKIEAARQAIENALLAQIRWPDRDECKAAFAARPKIVEKLSGEYEKAAGDQVEFRSKKL